MSKPTWSDYRAACITFTSGCRQCGAEIDDRRAYCSALCRHTFERNHFWNTARVHAVWLACGGSVNEDGSRAVTPSISGRPICARCKKPCVAEVNHIVPLNGYRPSFGCCHHQSNLEVLCHDCHLEATAQQRREGLIGPPRVPGPLLEFFS